ncbi:MAG: LPS export ABC transporter permease LptG [Gammaproteobacteria bacterium]|nr:LPS export ABC transporter permease LptG [Gammaproteobacteria bacterium]
MNTVDRYLMVHIAGGLFIAAAVLVPLFSFLDLLDQLDDVGEGFYGARDAFQYVILLLPRRLVQLAPFIALLGNVIALGRLAVHNELTAIRAAGLSSGRISGATLKAGVVLLLIIAMLEQWAAPVSQQKALALRSDALAQTTELGRDLGIWTRNERQILRIGDSRRARGPRDIEILRLDQQGRLEEHIRADHAEIETDRRWILRDVTRRQLANSEVKLSRLDLMVWEPFLSPEQISTLSRPPESLSPVELYEYVRYLRATGQQVDAYALALWRKPGGALTMIAMLLLSIPFAFGSVRTGLGHRLVFAAVLGIAAYLLDQIVSNAGLLLNLNPPVVALAPGLILIAIGARVVQRAR